MTACPACGGRGGVPSYLGRGRYRDFEYAYVACSACGSLFADPMPDDALLDIMYGPEYLDAHYAEALQGGATDAEIAAEQRRAVEWLGEARPGARVLDVGCGAGMFLTAAASAGLAAEGYERVDAVARIAERTTRCAVHSGELKDITSRYDAIHLADVLEHLPQPAEMLAVVRGLLAPGGVILARGPLENQTNLFHRLVVSSRAARRRFGRVGPIALPPYHVVLFTLAGWHGLLTRAQLRIDREDVYEIHWPSAPDAALGPRSIAKRLSLLLSASFVGRRAHLGNRVVSLAQRVSA